MAAAKNRVLLDFVKIISYKISKDQMGCNNLLYSYRYQVLERKNIFCYTYEHKVKFIKDIKIIYKKFLSAERSI